MKAEVRGDVPEKDHMVERHLRDPAQTYQPTIEFLVSGSVADILPSISDVPVNQPCNLAGQRLLSNVTVHVNVLPEAAEDSKLNWETMSWASSCEHKRT